METIKINFHGIDSLSEGIAILSDDLGIEASCECSADICLTVNETEEHILTASLDGKNASITYGGGKARFFRALAVVVQWVKDGETEKTVTEKPLFSVNGAMVDMSRDAVMNVSTVKFMLRKMALMGLNTYMLYTEDTYEVEGRPYFGYMRGRYTADEIRELDAYAIKLGIELVPCVQMLGHLATHLRWTATAPYKDTANALLVGAEETYKFIDDMLKAIASCFTSRRLHMGMDETHDLGTGKYLDKNGYRPRAELYFEHLAKVVEMAKSYGFKPMMWSDMFFRFDYKGHKSAGCYTKNSIITDDIAAMVPDGLQQVFWDYYNTDEAFYGNLLIQHDKLGENTMFAGGIWFWSGHCPQFSRSLRNTIPALEACRKHGTKEVIATIWQNGAESSLILSLAGLAWYADYDYTGKYDIDSIRNCFRFSCGLNYDEFMMTEYPEYPQGMRPGAVGATKALLYNDPMVGLIDKHVEGLDMMTFYKNLSVQLENIGANSGEFKSAFDIVKKLTSLLENKADYGLRLTRAYREGDKAALAALAIECDTIIEKVNALRVCHRESWMEYNKPFGWEVHDIRYGGLIMRFETTKARILDYLAGKTDRLEELEAERLTIDGTTGGSPNIGGSFLWNGYTTIATANKL